MRAAPLQSDVESGFVLPYVLVSIAVMSLLMSMVAIRLMDVSSSTRLFATNADAEVRLASLEAEAVYRLLTGVPGDEGLASASGATPLISGAGTVLTSVDDASASIRFQDMTGLIPLNGQSPDLLESYLRANDLSREEAGSLTAKLMDYMDEDDRRRFRGAERADYRMRQIPPPSNRPLRHHNELKQILGWPDLLPKVDMQDVLDETSISSVNVAFNPGFMPQPLLEKMERNLEGFMMDEILKYQDFLTIGTRPSNSWRVYLRVGLPDGRTQIRAIDVERTLAALNEPFSTNLIYERVESQNINDDVIENN